MNSLNRLAELSVLWSGSSLRVWGNRCLNVRHRARDCRICIDACPVDAISIPKGGAVDADPIVLDQNTCVQCGLCLHACPTGVFVQANPPEMKLSRAVARSASDTIELACPRKEPADLSRVPGASVIQAPRCLAALSVPVLLELVTMDKTVWLNDSICHTCPIGQAREAILRTIITANHWLQVMGCVLTIRSYLTADDELADEPVSRPVAPGNQSFMSRRDFFGSLTQLAGQAAASVIAKSDFPLSGRLSPSGETTEGAGRRLPHYIPAQRQHLAYALCRLSLDLSAPVATAALPIADVAITDACTACGLCAQFCPTEAITFVSDDEHYVLNFSTTLCLGSDCSLCVIGCPADAVLFGREVMAGELLSTQSHPLRAGRLAPCAQCGALTDAPDEADESGEAPMCYVCQDQAKRSDLLSGLPV